MKKHRVFIYGTLRREGARSIKEQFPSVKFIGGATIDGSLYDLGEYPGISIGDPESTVVGEVYEVDAEILKELDEFEAADGYRRMQMEARIHGRNVMCWIYSGDAFELSNQTRITSGDWTEYTKTRA
jgi:gamma-glutamylcyclotransferase (GGCT)/AIG2-like uncharacterized protein YtfP